MKAINQSTALFLEYFFCCKAEW